MVGIVVSFALSGCRVIGLGIRHSEAAKNLLVLIVVCFALCSCRVIELPHFSLLIHNSEFLAFQVGSQISCLISQIYSSTNAPRLFTSHTYTSTPRPIFWNTSLAFSPASLAIFGLITLSGLLDFMIQIYS